MALFLESQGSGKDVVLIHGGVDNHQFLSPIQQWLLPYYRVTWLDTPGIGESDWSDDIQTIDDMAEHILPEMPEKAVYIGWSFGGMLALAIAARHPERVERVICVTSTPRFLKDEDWDGMQGFHDIVIPSIRQGGLSTFLNEFIQHEYSKLNNREDEKALIKSGIPPDNGINLHAISKRIQMVDDTDLREATRTIQCPIDFIMGEEDSSIPHSQYQKIKALNPTIQLHIMKDMQHMGFWTHPEAFKSILFEILT